jgi:hypothetical protein
MPYDNKLSGALFKNDRKEPGSKQPDYTGTFTDADNVEWRLAGWIQESKAGTKFLKLKVSIPKERTQAVKNDEDIPF